MTAEICHRLVVSGARNVTSAAGSKSIGLYLTAHRRAAETVSLRPRLHQQPPRLRSEIREIDGFELETVPRSPVLPKPIISGIVPILYHGSKRVTPFRPAAACLPLYSVIARHDGTQRYADPKALAEKFGIGVDVPLVLTGTATDAPLERWWSLSTKRRDAIRSLRRLNVQLVTTPNDSLFTDRPRWDDLHSMKRIAIVYEEFLSDGVPAALHLNARTDRDWERWTRFVADREEVTHLAFEFGTGAGWATRIPWHLDQIAKLLRAVGRPLNLVIRGGGVKILPAPPARSRRHHLTRNDGVYEDQIKAAGVIDARRRRQVAEF